MDLVNSDSGAVEFAKRVDWDVSLVAISAISVHEYMFGVYYRYGKDGDDLFPSESAVLRG